MSDYIIADSNTHGAGFWILADMVDIIAIARVEQQKVSKEKVVKGTKRTFWKYLRVYRLVCRPNLGNGMRPQWRNLFLADAIPPPLARLLNLWPARQ